MGKNMMTRESFKEYIRNEIIEMLSEADPDDIKAQQALNKELDLTQQKADKLGQSLSKEDEEPTDAKNIKNTLGENEDNTQPPTTITIPEDTHYADFAKAVAKVLKEYGQHNYIAFMKKLFEEL